MNNKVSLFDIFMRTCATFCHLPEGVFLLIIISTYFIVLIPHPEFQGCFIELSPSCTTKTNIVALPALTTQG
jgi:hypothetical protein